MCVYLKRNTYFFCLGLKLVIKVEIYSDLSTFIRSIYKL